MRGIANDRNGFNVGKKQMISCDFLLGRMRAQGIRAGEIGDLVRALRFFMKACGERDGFSRPVSRVLSESRQGVENGAFSHVGIARERDFCIRVFMIHGKVVISADILSVFHKDVDVFCVAFPDGNDRAANTVRSHTSDRRFAEHGDGSAGNTAHIQQTAEGFVLHRNGGYRAAFALFQRKQGRVCCHRKNPFREMIGIGSLFNNICRSAAFDRNQWDVYRGVFGDTSCNFASYMIK